MTNRHTYRTLFQYLTATDEAGEYLAAGIDRDWDEADELILEEEDHTRALRRVARELKEERV